jgi:hypothetical protein
MRIKIGSRRFSKELNNALVKEATPVAYSREVPGYNLDQDSDYTDGDISWFC